MTERRPSPWGALSGLGFIALAVVGNEVVMGGAPDAELQSLQWLADHEGRLYGGLGIEMLGLLLAMVFGSYVVRLLPMQGWLAGAGMGGMIAAVAVKIASIAPMLAGIELADDLSNEMARVLVGINDASFALWAAPLALFMLAVGMGSRRGDALPSWLAWAAIVVSPMLLVNAVVGYHTENVAGFMLFMLWTVVASIVLAIRSRRVTSAA